MFLFLRECANYSWGRKAQHRKPDASAHGEAELSGGGPTGVREQADIIGLVK